MAAGPARGRRLALILGSAAVVLLAAVPDLARAQPPVPIYLGEHLRDCVTGNNQFYSGADGKFGWWVNQNPSLDRSRSTSGRCDSHQNDSYERPTDQTFRNNVITQKPAGAGPPFTYTSPAQPKSPVLLSGLAPDAELSQGQTAFSTESGIYFEFLDITRGQSGYITDGQTLAAALRNGLRRNVRCPAACRILVTVAVDGATARGTGLGTDRTVVAVGAASRDSAGRRVTFARFHPEAKRLLAGLKRVTFLVTLRIESEGRTRTIARAVTLGDGWMFFQIELFGEAEVTSDLERLLTRQLRGRSVRAFANGTFYTVRLGNNTDPNKANNGIALRNQLGSATPRAPNWASSGAKVYGDSNGSVSGAGGVSVPNPTDSAGNGYDLDRGNNGWLYVRWLDVMFTGPGGTATRPAIEFAFNYSKYNRDTTGQDFTPQNLTYVEFDSTRGLKDQANYLWNDKYSLGQAGSPYSNEAGGNGPGNVYQLDTLRMGGFPPPPPEPEPDLIVDKVPDDQTVSAGDPLVFAITVKNEGQGVAQDVQLRDQLPPGVTWTIKVAPPGADCNISTTGLLTCDLGDLEENEVRRVVVTAPTSFESCASYDNTATATAANDSASDTGSLTCQRPALVVQKTPDSQTVTAGQPIEFAVTVTNNGPGVARDVTLTDPLPPGPTWAIAQQPAPPATCAISAGTLTCVIGDLPAGTGIQVRVGASTSPAQCAVYNNTGTAMSTNHPNVGDGGSINCVLPPVPPIPPVPPDPPPIPPSPVPPPTPTPPPFVPPAPPSPREPELSIEKDANRRVMRPGEQVRFRLRVTNIGNEAATDVRVCDRLHPILVFASAPSGSIQGRRVCFGVRRLAPGRSVAFVVEAQAMLDAGGTQVVNTACVTADGEGPRCDSATVRVSGQRAVRAGGVTG